MIMDDNMDCETIWNALYHLRIDKTTSERIQSYSGELFRLSKSLQAWQASKYSTNLRVVNSETLQIVRDYWRQYSSADNLKSAFVDNYNQAIKKVYDGHHKDINSTDTIAASTKQFWNHGTFASSADLPNPLFAYSDASSSFAVHQGSNPLAGFHLSISLAKLESESQFYQARSVGSSDLESAISSAKLQFAAWCNAFRRLIKRDNPRRLVIRFFAGDAISLCLGIRAVSDPGIVANCYSQPGSAHILRLDINDRPPKHFDVIDSGYLVDRIGVLNLLPNVAQLLQNSCSVLYTSTRVADVAAEKNLLEKMLCGDVGIMCMLLGLVPASYLTGNTSFAYEAYLDSQSHAEIKFPLNNRIMWVMTKAGDHKLEWDRVPPSCDINSLAKFLFDLYKQMFSFESNTTDELIGSQAYTRSSFAVLLRFFKRRVINIDWRKCVSMVLQLLIEDQQKNGTNLRHVMGDLFVQLALCDVYLGGVDIGNEIVNSPTARIGVLRKRNPPDPCALVVVVPRWRLQFIYDKLSAEARRAPIVFQLYLRKEKLCSDEGCTCKHENYTVSCVQAVFGKLVVSADGCSGTIEADPSRWEGTSDLVVSGYISTLTIHSWGQKGPLKCGVALARTRETVKLFEAEFGEGLSVWKTCFGHMDCLYFFDRLPGLQRNPPKEDFYTTSHGVAQTTSSFVVDFPKLDFEKPSFTTHIKVIGPALGRLQKKDSISVNQLSPCTMTITFGGFQVQGNYIFPVDGKNTRLRVSRLQGWIEIIAPFVVPTQRGYFNSTPFPIVHAPWGTIYNTFRPYINFCQLPRLNFGLTNRDCSENGYEASTVPSHLTSMFFKPETSFPDENVPSMAIKLHIHTLLFPSTIRVVRLKSQNSEYVDIVFFVVGLYLDPTSRSVVGEGYAMPITTDVPSIVPQLDMKATTEEMRWWKSVLPGMVEQGRMWKHKPDCEYKFEGIPLPGTVSICSCGQGQVTSAFTNNKEWTKYAPWVTPVAISPIFPVPWLDLTRTNGSELEQAVDSLDIKNPKCKFCAKIDARKKCGKCMNVVYCSRECQIKDWRDHKASCASEGRA